MLNAERTKGDAVKRSDIPKQASPYDAGIAAIEQAIQQAAQSGIASELAPFAAAIAGGKAKRIDAAVLARAVAPFLSRPYALSTIRRAISAIPAADLSQSSANKPPRRPPSRGGGAMESNATESPPHLPSTRIQPASPSYS